MQRHLLMAVDFHLTPAPIDDPIFEHASARVELELGLAIPALILRSWREHLDREIGGGVQLTIGIERRHQALLADPDNIRRDIVVISKDHTGRDIRHAGLGLATPRLKRREQLAANKLVVPVGLFRHIQFPVDDLIALPVLREQIQISRCPAQGSCHSSPLPFVSKLVSALYNAITLSAESSPPAARSVGPATPARAPRKRLDPYRPVR